MSGKREKMLREQIVVEAKKNADDMHKFLYNKSFKYRLKLAWRILWKIKP